MTEVLRPHRSEDATVRPHRSHSQFTTLVECGHQYYLTRVRNLPEAPSVWLAGGGAFHTTTEQFDLLTWADTAPDSTWEPAAWTEQFVQNFNTELDALRAVEPDESKWRTAGKSPRRPLGDDATWWRQAGVAMVEKYIAWRLSNISALRIAAVKGAPAIELDVTVEFGGVTVKAFIDRVFRFTSTDQLGIVDMKSGKHKQKSILQLAQYSVQFEELTGEQCLYGAFYDAREGELQRVQDLSSWTKEKLDYIYRTADEQITRGLFLPNLNSFCDSCGVRPFCIYQGGSEPAID